MSHTKLESCIELDQMCACMMRELNKHEAVKHSDNVGLFSGMQLIAEALQNFHGQLKVVYQAEQGKTS